MFLINSPIFVILYILSIDVYWNTARCLVQRIARTTMECWLYTKCALYTLMPLNCLSNAPYNNNRVSCLLSHCTNEESHQIQPFCVQYFTYAITRNGIHFDCKTKRIICTYLIIIMVRKCTYLYYTRIMYIGTAYLRKMENIYKFPDRYWTYYVIIYMRVSRHRILLDK